MTREPFHEVSTLHRAGQIADDAMAEYLRDAGADITPRQAVVLYAISLSIDPSQTSLVDRTGVDRSTLADLVRRLVERGLVSRRRVKEDRRRYAVTLTVQGIQTLDRAMAADAAASAEIKRRVAGVFGRAMALEAAE